MKILVLRPSYQSRYTAIDDIATKKGARKISSSRAVDKDGNEYVGYVIEPYLSGLYDLRSKYADRIDITGILEAIEGLKQKVLTFVEEHTTKS